jgi:hypothetical protein
MEKTTITRGNFVRKKTAMNGRLDHNKGEMTF